MASTDQPEPDAALGGPPQASRRAGRQMADREATQRAAMPEHATVSVVVELSEGHLTATLLNKNQAPAITVLYYGADDPQRWGDARDAQVISLTRDEG